LRLVQKALCFFGFTIQGLNEKNFETTLFGVYMGFEMWDATVVMTKEISYWQHYLYIVAIAMVAAFTSDTETRWVQ